MPACELCCPLVKDQLKKIAAENPWILKKNGKSDIKHHVDTAAYIKIPSKSQSTMVSIFKGEGYDKLLETDPIERISRLTGDSTSGIGKKVDRDQETSIIVSKVGRDQETMSGIADKVDRDQETMSSIADRVDRGQEMMSSVADRVDRGQEMSSIADRVDRGQEMSSIADRVDRGQEMSSIADRVDRGQEMSSMAERVDGSREPADRVLQKVDRDQGTMREESVDGTDNGAIFPDQCDSPCPRRISRRIRQRKLEERQRIVDAYLLSKGTGYFDDICTCSLSCVIHALRDDTFVRSILMSTAFFAFGLKLCAELDAWQLPIRLS